MATPKADRDRARVSYASLGQAWQAIMPARVSLRAMANPAALTGVDHDGLGNFDQ
jgi:hypothetical protein